MIPQVDGERPLERGEIERQLIVFSKVRKSALVMCASDKAAEPGDGVRGAADHRILASNSNLKRIGLVTASVI